MWRVNGLGLRMRIRLNSVLETLIVLLCLLLLLLLFLIPSSLSNLSASSSLTAAIFLIHWCWLRGSGNNDRCKNIPLVQQRQDK